MTNFNHQLLNSKGELAFQREIDSSGDKPKTKEYPLALLRCADFALLDIAKTMEGMESEINSSDSMYKRYLLHKKISATPENVELSAEEKEIFTTLLPYHYEVRIVGQIMDLL